MVSHEHLFDFFDFICIVVMLLCELNKRRRAALASLAHLDKAATLVGGIQELVLGKCVCIFIIRTLQDLSEHIRIRSVFLKVSCLTLLLGPRDVFGEQLGLFSGRKLLGLGLVVSPDHSLSVLRFHLFSELSLHFLLSFRSFPVV